MSLSVLYLPNKCLSILFIFQIVYTDDMGTKDVITKSLIREIVMDMALYLLDLKIIHLEEAATERQRIEVRQADIVMKAEDESGEHFILHLELQNDNDAKMPLRMMRYYTDIALSYPDELIRQYVIYIGQASLTMAKEVSQTSWHYNYQLIDMHTLDCEQFIHEDNPDALVLAILCDFKDKESSDVVEGIIRRLIELTGNQPERLQNYLKMLETLSTNRNLSQIFQEVENKMLSEIEIEKLPSYRIGEARGEARGEAIGEARGEAIGEARGIENERIQMIFRASSQGIDVQAIASISNLSVEKVKSILGINKEE